MSSTSNEIQAETDKIDSQDTLPEAAAKDSVKNQEESSARLDKLQKSLKNLSHKSIKRINQFREELTQVKKLIEADQTEAIESLRTSMELKFKENLAYQKELQNHCVELLLSLKTALDDGRSEQAMSIWDKIQGNISNTEGKIRSELQSKTSEHKMKLDELKDWKSFASTEKKKELIKQMQHLFESKMAAADRSKHINKMHAQWKALGRSHQNESLWKEFKTLSDKAYEPCKIYFKKRKELMASNLKKRKQLCDSLENELTTIKPDEVDISRLSKLLNTLDADWKKYAPVEQSKIRTIQKRFYSGVNKVRKIRKKLQYEHARLKKQCIADACALTELEDNKKAINEAKRLQEHWKTIGPTSYRDDSKYWKDFRAACDKIFSIRSQNTDQQREDNKELEKVLSNILSELESIFALNNEELRGARPKFEELAQKFSNSLNPRLKQQRKKFLDQFNVLKQKIEGKLNSLPDKKQQKLRADILTRTEFLQSIETELLAQKEDQAYLECLQSIEQATWKKLDIPAVEKFNKVLNERFAALLKTSCLKELEAITKTTEEHLRKLCIETEVRANIPSPDSDQALRMQVQLQQLQQGFGKNQQLSKQNKNELLELELDFICLACLTESAREELRARLGNAINKLQQKLS